MKYAILLRGVNIGGRTVRSAELKASFLKAGFKNAQTVLATGNVIIESDKKPDTLKSQIEKLLEAAFNFPVKVLVISIEKLTTIITAYPFKQAGPEFHRYIVFKDPGNKSMQPDIQPDEKLEAVKPGEGVLYWRVLKGHTLDSNFAKYLAKSAKKEFSTTRNINTLEKILTRA